jgi:hypothetical protein
LSVHQRQGSELDRGHLGVHAVQRWAPAHPAYVATRAGEVLDGGLHGMLPVAAAWPAKWAVQGPHRRAPSMASPAGTATVPHVMRERCDSSRVRAHRWLR